MPPSSNTSFDALPFTRSARSCMCKGVGFPERPSIVRNAPEALSSPSCRCLSFPHPKSEERLNRMPRTSTVAVHVEAA